MATKKGLDGRMRDKSGQIRHKRRDTHVSTLRAEYGESFAPGFKPADTLGKVLDKTGAATLHEYLKTKKPHR
ncbi:MAG: hypothetical protein ABSF50_14225 [Burkholderiaceae bacterium]|jgi:hypothetical protein